MREAEAIISAYELAKMSNQACVLATVVHVEGSSYRRAGARMLVDENGVMTGAISGGCLEGDALRKALHALDQKQNKLITYDTSDEDDAVIGAQLGCSGIIQVLFEPLDVSNGHNPVELLKTAVRSGDKSILVSLFNLQKSSAQRGTTLLLDHELTITGSIQNQELLQQLKVECHQALANQISHFSEYRIHQEHIHSFIQFFAPPQKLVVVGAGNDAQLLTQMATPLGWDITIADGRPTHANRERFAGSCQIVVSNPEGILKNVTADEHTAFVLMTHNYHYDLAVLKLLLDKPEIPYIGILGPKKKYSRMLEDLMKEGITLSEAQSKTIYAPIGLHIGAETPAEIGLSVLSEIQAVLTQSHPMHLRERNGAIHNNKHNEFKVVYI